MPTIYSPYLALVAISCLVYPVSYRSEDFTVSLAMQRSIVAARVELVGLLL